MSVACPSRLSPAPILANMNTSFLLILTYKASKEGLTIFLLSCAPEICHFCLQFYLHSSPHCCPFLNSTYDLRLDSGNISFPDSQTDHLIFLQTLRLALSQLPRLAPSFSFLGVCVLSAQTDHECI